MFGRKSIPSKIDTYIDRHWLYAGRVDVFLR
jgi:hypothetical protein